jgi:hypothetical protein
MRILYAAPLLLVLAACGSADGTEPAAPAANVVSKPAPVPGSPTPEHYGPVPGLLPACNPPAGEPPCTVNCPPPPPCPGVK